MKNMNMYRCFYAALALALGLALPAAAQQADTALIVGTVSDTTGAVIPGVTVTFNHVETGTVYTSETNESGNYRSNPLRIGAYLVVIEADGFKAYSGSGINLSIGDTRQLDVSLEIGAVTEVIEVEAAAPLLQTTEASAGTVIENRQIVDLPLNGRDYLQLAVISAGVVASRGQGVSIGGQRGTETSFLIDGMDNNNQSIASQGGQKEVVKPTWTVSPSSRSSPTAFPPSTAARLRASSRWPSSRAPTTCTARASSSCATRRWTPSLSSRPARKRNSDASSTVFRSAARSSATSRFCSATLELTDIRESSTFVSTVPTPAMRNGDFNDLGQTVYDPFTNGQAVGAADRQAFPDNTIPMSRFDPRAAIIKDWWPDPQSSDLQRNYVFQPPRNNDFDKWDIRWDHNLSAADNIFARWSYQQQVIINPPQLPATQFGSMTRGGPQDRTSNNAVFGWNRIWSPALVSNFRFG